MRIDINTSPSSESLPSDIGVTELGIISKEYIDCGGTIRKDKTANFQLWTADDLDHRIEPEKIIDIIDIAENSIGLSDLEIEVEYQSETIGKYGLQFVEGTFHLSSTQTDCLAKDKCGIPEKTDLPSATSSCCSPTTGCC